MKKQSRNSFWQIWTQPLLLSLLTLFALVSALVGSGLWHVLAWLTLGLPPAICAYYGLRNRPDKSA